MIPLRSLVCTIFLVTVIHHTNGKSFLTEKLQSLGWKRNDPPAPNNEALMARYIVHNSDWASVGTKSEIASIKGYPFVGLKSIADGTENNSTGVIYMLMTDMDVSMNDLNHDNKCTLFLSLAQGDFCKKKDYDPQDPRCARVMLTGSVEKLAKNSEEADFAKTALYEKHPAMSWWPSDHGFYFVKLNLLEISLIDYFGGIKHVTPAEYFAAKQTLRNYLFTNRIEVVQKLY